MQIYKFSAIFAARMLKDCRGTDVPRNDVNGT